MRLRSLILSIVVTILLSGCSSVKSFFGSSKKQQRQKAGTEVVAENISARTSESDGNSLSENLKSDNNVCAIPGVERPEAMIKPLKARPEMSFGETESANVRIPLRYNNPFPESGELVVPLCELETEFCYPYPGKLISPFGRRGRSNHTGIDIKAIPNDTIRAAMPGVVRMSKPYSGYGNLVVIRHYNGIETVYAHQSRNLVRVNDVVEAGDPIGLAGRTGRATTEHVHFEVRVASEPVNPTLLVDPDNRCLRSDQTLYCYNRGGAIRVSTKRATTYIPDSDGNQPIFAQTLEPADKTAPRESSPATAAERDNSPQQTAPTYHDVKKGETLSHIAVNYSTTVSKLCALNGIKPNSLLQIKQKLRVK